MFSCNCITVTKAINIIKADCTVSGEIVAVSRDAVDTVSSSCTVLSDLHNCNKTNNKTATQRSFIVVVRTTVVHVEFAKWISPVTERKDYHVFPVHRHKRIISTWMCQRGFIWRCPASLIQLSLSEASTSTSLLHEHFIVIVQTHVSRTT